MKSTFLLICCSSLSMFLAACVAGPDMIRFNPSDVTLKPGTVSSWNFDAEKSGSLPKGSSVFSGKWAVRAEPGSPSGPNALCQTGNADFPSMTLSDEVYANFTLETRFKAVSGQQDRAAGLIFRSQDAKNHLIVRANALENNLRIYVFSGGQRGQPFADGSVPLETGKWHALKLEVIGSSFKAFVDGKLVTQGSDGTFKAGRIGLWTKADSVTCFDDVTVTAQ